MSTLSAETQERIRSLIWSGEPLSVANRGLVLTVLVAAALALLEVSPLGVLAGVTVATAATAKWIHHAVVVQRRKLDRLSREQVSEVEDWKQRWHELQRETQEATSVLARMRDGVIMLSADAEVLLINPAARRLLRVREELELNHRPLPEVVRIPELSSAIAAANAGDGVQKLMVEIPHDRSVCPVRIRVDRFDAVGDNHLLVTLRDETESYRLDEMRREFVANISHELKTPLAAIKGYAETVELAIQDDPDAAVHFVAQIQTQCQRLERLIADMMQLARAQSGRRNLNITRISMVDSINEAMKSFRPVAEAKHVELNFEPPELIPHVLADSEAMLTITNNLIGNAVRYTPQGGSVTVSCREAGEMWALMVEDTGIGIDERDQRRIFERFYRVGKGRGGSEGGTGIGLAIVKNLTLTLGGEVRVSSRPREGSKFEVLLPKPGSEAHGDDKN